MKHIIAFFRAMRRTVHVHSHEMTFPNGGLGWVFVCKCGHSTTDIFEAMP